MRVMVAALFGFASGPVVAQKNAAGKPPQGTRPELLEIGDRSKFTPVPAAKRIAFALYTVQDGVLKLTAHLHPLQAGEAAEVVLDIDAGAGWQERARAKVHPLGGTAVFRVEGWDMTRTVKYRVRHANGSAYDGVIRRDPVDKNEVVAAVFTGNSPGPGGGKIPKRDVVDNVLKANPDVLLFTGDQVYNHYQHTAAWLEFGDTFGDLMRDRPTVCIPDDHDIGQPNMWGAGGRKADLDTKGGYTRPAAYVKLVERQQTSHLPDPFDPTPIGQGIGVYYTSLNIGGIDFAILEDRKFKSGCFDFDLKGKGLGPRPDHIDKAGYDPKQFDVAGKKLLGDRQLAFLDAWGQDWDGVVMKAVVSQTLFGMASTHHGSGKTFYYADFDANGWPQTGRNKAVEAMRKCYAVHLAGDQHLATILRYGVDDWRDSSWAFVVPSIANLWPRWWEPKTTGRNPEPGAQDHTGDFLDGFGNRLTVVAHTNPVKTGRKPAELHDRMPGWGLARFDKAKRAITFECWPRMTDPTDPASKQYRGWPRTISQFDNYPRPGLAHLPEIVLKKGTDPVIQVRDETNGEVLYTVRALGKRFQPKVFKIDGTYTVRVDSDTARKEFKGVRPVNKDDPAVIEIDP